jgi:hypothetical protein
MWPAEGSVCQAMVPLLARHGLAWVATDEEILAHSIQGMVQRDGGGHVMNPDVMYRPYRVLEGGQELSIVFRDHALSDLIGFHYQRTDPLNAAEDFVARGLAIGRAIKSNNQALVSVILDGENCWEHYPGGGVTFLRSLYERLTSTRGLRPVTIGSYLHDHPPQSTLPHLFAGSWINHNFAIWIGHDEDNSAWDALHEAREHLRRRSAEWGVTGRDAVQWPQPNKQPQSSLSAAERISLAMEEILIAEGSDWFWWYGDDHSCDQIALFDYLFRKHLQNAYLLLGDHPPPELARPISRRGHQMAYTLPRTLLDVRIDGRQTFFEWFGAGRLACHGSRGTMAMAKPGPIKDVYFGFSLSTLFIRLDFGQPAQSALSEFAGLRIIFTQPPGCELRVTSPGRADQQVSWHCAAALAPSPAVSMAIASIAELSIPFAELAVTSGQSLEFYVELFVDNQSRDRAPREGVIALTCPSADFEHEMWDV